jgi:hypothetical protein
MKLLRNKMLIAKETIREIFHKDHPIKDLCHNLTLRGAEMPSKREGVRGVRKRSSANLMGPRGCVWKDRFCHGGRQKRNDKRLEMIAGKPDVTETAPVAAFP